MLFNLKREKEEEKSAKTMSVSLWLLWSTSYLVHFSFLPFKPIYNTI